MNWQNNDITEMTARLPGEAVPWLRELRAQQWQRFLQRGLPTRQDEGWKYTDISSITQQAFVNVPDNLASDELVLKSNQQDAIELIFVNGQLKTIVSDLPSGLVMCDLRSALHSHPEWVKRGLSQHQENGAGMVNFNTSLWENGLFIMVADDAVIDKPIVVRYLTTVTEPSMMVLRNIIFLGKNSQLTLFQDFQSDSTAPYWQHSITQINCAEHAQLNHIKCQQEGLQSTHLSENLVQQSSESLVNSSSFALGAKLHREAWQVSLTGRAARCHCRGLAIANNTQHLDAHLILNHQAPACISEQVFKSIASDKSRTIFNGKVVVEPSGQQAQAHQLSQNLLLSALAEIDTRPELEIYADDVKCSHGASVGQLDPDALFYLQSRGIDHEQASGMLLHAFIHDQLVDLEPWIQALIAPLLEQKLAHINGVQCQ